MTFFHLSDLHLGLKLINHDLIDDQTYILNKIIDYVRDEQPDAVIIAGDIYDKAIPPAEAVELFDSFISDITVSSPQTEVMLISGNHDSASRVNTFRSILRHHHIHMIGLPPMSPDEHIEKVTLHDDFGPVNFYLLPFVKPSMIKSIVGTDASGNNLSYDDSVHKLIERESIDTQDRNILVSHQFYLPKGASVDSVSRMDSEIITVGNIDQICSDVLFPFDYAALGHIHKPMTVGNEFYRYCGTPLACSVSEAGQDKGIIKVTLGPKGDISTDVLPLIPKRQVRVLKGSLQDILTKGCDYYVTVILTDMIDLDVFDMQDRLRHEFPNLLEIRRETLRKSDYQVKLGSEKLLNPFELCTAFLKDLDDDEQEILEDIINTVKETR